MRIAATTRILIVLAVTWSPGRDAAGDDATIPAQIDFDTDVMPLFTKFGCNSGACHGAAVGRGHLKLSLFASRPANDYSAIVNHLEGRRINLVDPDKSLVLLKPTDLVTHGGGERFTSTSPAATLLRDWIRQGALPGEQSEIQDWKIVADPVAVDGPTSRTRLRSTVMIADAEPRNVTAWTLFTAEDPEAVTISTDASSSDASIVIHRPGRHVVIARYLNRVSAVELLVPFPTREPARSRRTEHVAQEPAARPSQQVDALIEQRLKELHLSPGPQATDDEFRRRAFLDLTGRLPTRQDIEASTVTAPLNRNQLVDELIASDEFTDFWTFRMMRWLELDTLRDVETARVARNWLRAQLADNASWNSIVSTMLLAEGSTRDNGATAFHSIRPDARLQAEHVSEVLAGVRLRCANCHDHPLDRWTQNDYHGFAAVFAGLQRTPELRFTGRGTVIHPATGQPAVPQCPGGAALDAGADARPQVVRWLLDPEHQVLATNMTNRIWTLLIGRGLCDPVDDLRPTNPSAHQDLLEQLTLHFVESQYDLRSLVRVICQSRTYGRSSHGSGSDLHGTAFFAHARKKPLAPEVLLDAIGDATAVGEPFADEPGTTRCIHLPSIHIASAALQTLRGCQPDETRCAPKPASSPVDTPQFLSLLNGPVLNQRLQQANGILAQLARAQTSPADCIRQLFLRTLSRPPSDEEMAFWINELPVGSPAEQQQSVLEDLLWSLLVCDEFVMAG